MVPMTNELVFGFCDYTWDKSAPFVRSLRCHGYKGDIVFFGNVPDAGTLSMYNDYDVKVKKVNNLFNFQDVIDYLSVNFYEKVFASDVRDVVFQDNPFYYFDTESLFLFEEDLNIGEQSLNAHWIRHGYGQVVLDTLKDRKIINAGISCGGVDAVIECLSMLRDKLISSTQATLDFLVYTGQIRAKIFSNNGGFVWNIGTKIDTEHDDFYVLDAPYICTKQHILPVVVHQYDRHPGIANMIKECYAE